MLLGMSLAWVFLLLFDFTIALEIGPSLDSLIPGDGSQTRDTVRREIHLEAYFPSYAIVLPLTNGSISGGVLSVHPSGDFVVRAPPDHGIMVVVQSLRLRTSVLHSEAEDVTFLKCRDYVKFMAGNQSNQVCGHVAKYSRDGTPTGLLGPRSFITFEPQLTIGLHIDKTLADHNFGWHEVITLELVVTAFKECPQASFVSQVSQWLKRGGSSGLKSCSPAEDRICISSDSYCDGVMNCGVKGPLGHIGYDEESCKPFRIPPFNEPPLSVTPAPTLAPRPSTTTSRAYIGVGKPYNPPPTGKVISPIHLILIFSGVVLVIFAACTWLAKANEKKFQHTMYRFSTMRRNRHRERRQARNSPSEQTLPRLASAPAHSAISTNERSPEGAVVVPIGEEPPPYDDLFPTAPPLSLTPSPTN